VRASSRDRRTSDTVDVVAALPGAYHYNWRQDLGRIEVSFDPNGTCNAVTIDGAPH